MDVDRNEYTFNQLPLHSIFIDDKGRVFIKLNDALSDIDVSKQSPNSLWLNGSYAIPHYTVFPANRTVRLIKKLEDFIPVDCDTCENTSQL